MNFKRLKNIERDASSSLKQPSTATQQQRIKTPAKAEQLTRFPIRDTPAILMIRCAPWCVCILPTSFTSHAPHVHQRVKKQQLTGQ
mgnify:CR=1 FL=1